MGKPALGFALVVCSVWCLALCASGLLVTEVWDSVSKEEWNLVGDTVWATTNGKRATIITNTDKAGAFWSKSAYPVDRSFRILMHTLTQNQMGAGSNGLLFTIQTDGNDLLDPNDEQGFGVLGQAKKYVAFGLDLKKDGADAANGKGLGQAAVAFVSGVNGRAAENATNLLENFTDGTVTKWFIEHIAEDKSIRLDLDYSTTLRVDLDTAAHFGSTTKPVTAATDIWPDDLKGAYFGLSHVNNGGDSHESKIDDFQLVFDGVVPRDPRDNTLATISLVLVSLTGLCIAVGIVVYFRIKYPLEFAIADVDVASSGRRSFGGRSSKSSRSSRSTKSSRSSKSGKSHKSKSGIRMSSKSHATRGGGKHKSSGKSSSGKSSGSRGRTSSHSDGRRSDGRRSDGRRSDGRRSSGGSSGGRGSHGRREKKRTHGFL